MIEIKAEGSKCRVSTDGTLEDIVKETLGIIDSLFKVIVPEFRNAGLEGALCELAFIKTAINIANDSILNEAENFECTKIDPKFISFMKGLEDND